MYKKATKRKLRIETKKGHLSIEDLWDLNLDELNEVAKDLNRSLKEATEENFLEKKSKEDKTAKLSFDIVIDIIETKQEDAKRYEMRKVVRAKKQRLLEIKEKRQDESLEKLSDEDLDGMIAALDEGDED